jgi:Leucine-rich repeat (LRR) protein
MNTEQPAAPKHKLRWYQYSLRSLFILTFLVAIASSWLAVKMGQARRQKEAVEALLKLGGTVNYDYEISSEGYLINGAKLPGPAWLRKIIGDDFYINVNGANFTLMKVTDVDLEYLEAWKQLRNLQLGRTQITDAGLEHLNGLIKLQRLDLSGTQITDAGLEHLKGLKQLQLLNLVNTHITDAGLEHLQGLTQLKYVHLAATQVTDAGVAKLQKALPDCYIVH